MGNTGAYLLVLAGFFLLILAGVVVWAIQVLSTTPTPPIF